MLNFLLLMIIPIAMAIGSIYWYRSQVTLQEFGAQLAVPAVCMVVGLLMAYYQSTTDIEVWNGRVTAKQSVRVSCRHSHCCVAAVGVAHGRSSPRRRLSKTSPPRSPNH